MIKRYLYFALAALLTTSVLIGCGKSNNVNTSTLNSSFSSAEPTTKGQVDAAVESIKAGNYTDAMAKLQAIAAQAKLTPAQQQAIQDVIAQVKAQLTAAAGQAQKDADKAIGDLPRSLGK